MDKLEAQGCHARVHIAIDRPGPLDYVAEGALPLMSGMYR